VRPRNLSMIHAAITLPTAVDPASMTNSMTGATSTDRYSDVPRYVTVAPAGPGTFCPISFWPPGRSANRD